MQSSNFSVGKNRIKAAIYARVSTLLQAREGLGLEGQIKICEKWCKIRGYEIYEIYKDSVSGTVDEHDRLSLNKLLEDAKDKKFQIVVCYKIDRLGRKMSVIMSTMEKFELFKVKPIFVEDQIDTTTDEGMLMFNILASVSVHELKKIRSRLQSGYDANRDKNGDIGGKLPYGYVRYDGEISIDETKADIVRSIFYNHIDLKKSMNLIGNQLNDSKIETPSKKGKWYAKTVMRIINNKNKYNGTELINNNKNDAYWPKIL